MKAVFTNIRHFLFCVLAALSICLNALGENQSGFYSIKRSTDELVFINSTGNISVIGNTNIPNLGKYNGMDFDIYGGLWINSNSILYKLSTEDGHILEQHSISGSNVGPGMSFSADNQLYILNEIGAWPEGTLNKIDFVTNQSIPISTNTSGLPSILAIEFDHQNQLWLLDECCLDKLSLLSTSTGQYFNSAESNANSSFTSDLDFSNGTLYGININDETSSNTTRFFTIDISTGLTTQLFTISGIFVGMAGKSNSVNLQDGLVAYYPFNGNANDESGNGNNGTVNGALLTMDRFSNASKAFNFNGLTDYINVGTTLGNFGLSDFTISVWMQAQDNQSDISSLISKRNWFHDSNFFDFEIGYTTTFDGVLSADINQDVDASLYRAEKGNVNKNIYDNIWHNAMLIRQNGQLILVTDGQKIYSDNVVGTGIVNLNNNAKTIIGARGDYYDFIVHFFKGSLDDIRIYNRAVSDAEIQALYNEASSITGILDKQTETNESFSIYPNPNSGAFTIETSLSEPVISVVNGLGIKIKTLQLPYGQKKTTIGGIPAGIYIVTINAEHGYIAQKVIIE